VRAAAYARVSTERRERQQTIDSQLSALRAWAEAEGHQLSDRHLFRDEGHSGARLDRPGLDALRDAVRDGEVEVVVVLAPDRLARKYAYQVLLLEEFRRAGCAVAFLGHAISDDPGDQLLLQIQGAVAEYERALLGERFRRGKLQKARAGQFIGVHAPYGYRRLPRRDGAAGRLVVDEAEAEVVRMLYGWLTEERLTLRRILERLNDGPWLPRCGRRPWAAGTVHHILADPVYAGTAYANRYEYVAAAKPRGGRGPGRGGRGCRRSRPEEQWIPIAVPPLVGRELWDRARAQLARNAVLSFRNNTRRDYLLRCLLTCGGCGLAMHGATWPTPGGGRRYYRCGGRDCLRTGRAQPCPRACVDGEALERAVWGHVRELLADPDRLTAQFRHLAAEADRERGPERRLSARLDGLARADARLLDAYQAEVIGLEELAERRRQLAGQRHALERELERQRDLRGQRTRAQEVLADLTAFCERVRGRLDEASFADRQAVLQLVVERVIVHEGSLEIRHVIPLHSPPPGREGPSQADGRLRSDRVHDVAGPGGARAGAEARLGVVGRLDRLRLGRRVLLRPEAHAAARRGPVLPHEVAGPDLA
jgi:site-specific DNA recombinase